MNEREPLGDIADGIVIGIDYIVNPATGSTVNDTCLALIDYVRQTGNGWTEEMLVTRINEKLNEALELIKRGRSQ